jgi:hypothetical protein
MSKLPDILAHHAQGVLDELQDQGFPNLNEWEAPKAASPGMGWYVVLAGGEKGPWFEIWIDELLGEPNLCLCIQTSTRKQLLAMIAQRPIDLTPKAKFTDDDLELDSRRYKAETIARIRQLPPGALIRWEHAEHFLGTYVSQSDFDPVEAARFLHAIAGHDGASPGAFLEGRGRQMLLTRYERSWEARERCLSEHGHSCKVCDFNFAAAYGAEVGGKYIHVHHIVPLAQAGTRRIDPVSDLIPVCPNCHAMLHSQTPPMAPSLLRELIAVRKRG